MTYKNKHLFFSPEDENRLMAAIASAEKNTSGEVRIRVERKSNGDPYKRAVEVFDKLGMSKTALRNGILFYLATEDRKFALIGDKGIHERVSDTFWSEITAVVMEHFSKGQFTEGMCKGIDACGIALSEYFPYQEDDVNELSDEISKGDLS